jgi:hypothetical protein
VNAVTTIVPAAHVQIEILNARDEFGSTNPVSVGAVAFAAWLYDVSRKEGDFALVTSLGGWGPVQRMIADAITPGLEFSELLGAFTGGAVQSKMWLQPYAGELVRAAHLSSADPAVVAAPAEPEPFPVVGQLGAIPPGPLFRHFAVPDQPGARVITGFGFAFAGGDAELCALRDTATAAIDAIRGGAQA